MGKRGALLESFLFITEVSPCKKRWWISFGSFVLSSSLNTQDCCSLWVWHTLSRNEKKNMEKKRTLIYCTKKRNDARQESQGLLHLLINTFIPFFSVACMPFLLCIRHEMLVNESVIGSLLKTDVFRKNFICYSVHQLRVCRSLFFRLMKE